MDTITWHSPGLALILVRSWPESTRDGGCNFPVDPSHDASEAAVFWSPRDDTGVVLLTQAAEFQIEPNDIEPDISGRDLHVDELGTHLRYDLGNGQHVQLLCHGNAERAGALAALVPLGLEGFDRLEALYRFLAVLHRRRVPPDSRLTAQQRARARRMLQAWDGLHYGATQQDIARVVLRQAPLGRDDWQAASARYAVMALLRDARGMIAGGYRKLLHHRRRS
ncbi:DUF2285 domain-containing protein [Labrys sp. KB_33_2]|uniref:DUF2285 domain-containing protein n=1 Tax=Labrys sp. KB_33_2 TaxID=3237479 RepID=UPI003F91986C